VSAEDHNRCNELARKGSQKDDYSQKNFKPAENMARLREFSRFMTNELSNPLTAITSYTEMCRELVSCQDYGKQTDSQVQLVGKVYLEELLDLISFNADRLGQLLNSFQKPIFSNESKWQITHVDEVVSETARALSTELYQKRINLEIQQRPPRAPILADPAQLGQAVLAIIENSIQNVTRAKSYHQKRVVKISYKQVMDTQGRAKAIEIEFSDSGPSYSNNAIRPFIDSETNMIVVELSTACTIIERHGGILGVNNVEPGVTAVHCSLPICKVSPEKLAELRQFQSPIYTST